MDGLFPEVKSLWSLMNIRLWFTLRLLVKIINFDMLPCLQERVYEELNAIFGESKRQATMKDTQEMRYMDQVIKETLRLYPSVPIFLRKLREDLPLSSKKQKTHITTLEYSTPPPDVWTYSAISICSTALIQPPNHTYFNVKNVNV